MPPKRDVEVTSWEHGRAVVSAEHSKSPEFLEWLSELGTVIETHGSWVVVSEDRALKFKKPVDLGFLDFSSREKRQALCQREVELNRRLAPNVYRSVLPLYLTSAGYVLGDERGAVPQAGDLELVDHAVAMRRLDEALRADVLLAQGRLDVTHLRRLAERLVAFHAGLRPEAETASLASPEALAANVRENFEELEPLVLDVLSPGEWQALRSAQADFLDKQAPLFQARAHAGFVRDGHGDLRLEHVYFEGEDVLVVDCIEFNDRFRYADTALDIAFLSMDLRHSGRPDLAEDFLAEVARLGGDYEAYALIDFYESYRATVRGKVAAFRAHQLGRDTDARAAAHRDARAFLLQALQSQSERGTPRLICVGGLIASGKSTLCRGLSTELHCPHIDTDGTRKHLLGFDPNAPLVSAPFVAAYTAEQTDRTYARVLELSRSVLRSGRTVIVDASFRTRAWRERFVRLAQDCGCPIAFIECRADEASTRQRLRRRAEEPGRSDGRLETWTAFRDSYEAIEPGEFAWYLACDTGAPGGRPLEQVLAFLRVG